MAQVQSLEDQSAWCNTTKYYLNDLNGELKYVSNQYQSSVEDLKNFGYIAEHMPHLQYLYSEFEQTLNNVINYIESEHIAYIDERSQTIQSIQAQGVGHLQPNMDE